MRIAIISPYSTGTMRGNITTVRRIAASLEGAGVDVAVFPLDAFSREELDRNVHSFSPDIVHAFHAYYCGETACNLSEQLKIPCVITITGSDVNEPAFRDSAATVRAIAAVDALVCFDDAEAAIVTRHFSGSRGRLVLIPQGVETLPAGRCPEFPGDAFVVLLPAALRPVKNVEFPLRALAPLCGRIEKLLLVIAGGVIDQEYAACIREILSGTPFARWLGEVPYERMGSLYTRADVVLNCSRFEGMPNSLLEAMALARPVLAADVPGNRSLVNHGRTGLLYRDESDFRNQVVRLAGDPGLCVNLGKRARDFVLVNFPRAVEAERYIKLYKGLRDDLP